MDAFIMNQETIEKSPIQIKIPSPKYKYWIQTRDGDSAGMRLYKRHYSSRDYKDGRQTKKYVGPGEYIALITPDCKALFVWRKFISMDSQEGINCAIFRNETEILSSELILEAEKFAIERWGPIRFYTYVNPRKIKSTNPGYCFQMARWKRCGRTKSGLIVLDKIPWQN